MRGCTKSLSVAGCRRRRAESVWSNGIRRRLLLRTPADWKSAIQQLTKLRHAGGIARMHPGRTAVAKGNEMGHVTG